MMEFNVGDRVVSVVDSPEDNHRICVGSTGTVCRVGTGRIGIGWDEYVGGHDCQGYCTDGHGWWVDIGDIELVDDSSDEPFEFDENEFNELVFGGVEAM